MSGEFIPSIKKYASKNKKNIFLVVLLAVGIFLLAFSSSPDEYDRNSQEESLEAYKARLEEELCELCSSVSGVGKCRVTVTFENGETIYLLGKQYKVKLIPDKQNNVAINNKYFDI